MYVIKNALRCIGRAKGRQVLIGIIVLVIALSACLGLSIRQAAENAKTETIEGMSVTATISYDRGAMMSEMRPPEQGEGGQSGGFDRENFAQMMGNASELTLEEYQTYAEASSVKNFYYELTASLNGSEDFEPVTTETETEDEDSDSENGTSFPGGFPGGSFGGRGDRVMMAQSDFSIVGYSGEDAMTSFVNGTATVTEGEVFTEQGKDNQCIISEELATYNDIAVGDTVTLTNPNDEEQTYTLTVTGLYSDSSANENSFSIMGSTATDPANKIYMSYTSLAAILATSEEKAETVTDEDTGREYTTEVSGSLSATYAFADVESYNLFEEQVREMGLDDSYTVSSSDLNAFEQSLAPLNTLSTTAGGFLVVILIIGAVILVVLNIFNVRERKYEIGVLTAMGMKKGKVALQFLTEIFVVTLVAVVIGAAVGAITSVPVTNALLANQIATQDAGDQRVEANFGRGEMPDMSDIPSGGGFGGFGGMGNPFETLVNEGAVEYVSEINAAMNFTVVWQMLLIAVGLTLVAGAVSMLFVMRYDPLRILANRD